MSSGISDFAGWAAAQGFDLVPHVDEAAPVTANGIFNTIDDAVRADDVERLFVFFSGHGLAPGVGDDLWLLTDAANDPGAAINVAKSVSLARYCGIPHVAFFADACRTPPDVRFNGLVGRPIFPLFRVPNLRVQVDQFFATVSGDPAYESQPDTAAAAFGIFSTYLIEALRGQHDDLLRKVADGPASHALLARPLGDYLWQTVRAVSAAQVGVTQTPDCIPTSVWKPNALAWFDRGLAQAAPEPAAIRPPAPSPTHGIGADAPADDTSAADEFGYEPVAPAAAADDRLLRMSSPWRPPARPDRRTLVDTFANHIVAEPGSTHFETRMGASIIGAEVARVFLEGGDEGVFEEDGHWQIRGVSGRCGALLTELRTGDATTWVATALMPGFVTTVTIGEQGAEHVAFVSIDGDSQRDLYALAVADAAFRTGDFGFVDDDEARRLVEEGNPTMAVLAASAFDRAGRGDGVRRVLDACRRRDRRVPFDVVLLADALLELADDVVPGYPLMTRGWALADELPAGERWLHYARGQLAHAPWTTFRQLSEDAVVALGQSQRGVAYA